MKNTTLGMIIGAILGLTAVAFGFWAMIGVALFIAIGYLVGRVSEGTLDLRGVADALRGRRTS